MLLLTLLFTLFSPNETNDQLLVERMEQNIELIESLASSQNREPISPAGELIEENGKILAFYFLPERLYENEKGFFLIQSLIQEYKLLSRQYSKETLDQIKIKMNRFKKYMNQSHLIEQKPWERGWEYKRRPALKRDYRKNDRRNRPCPAR